VSVVSSKSFRVSVLIAAILAALVACSSAQALTVGQLAPSNPPAVCNHTAEYDEVQITVASGNSYVVPASGVITSWSTNAAEGEGQHMGFKVYRPAGPGAFTIVAHDGPQPLVPSVLNTFPVSIPVLAGDVIGIYDPPTSTIHDACSFLTAEGGDELWYQVGNLPDGSTFAPTESHAENGFRINVAATLLPAPSITAISPASGPVAGGTSVTVTGANFAQVQSVSFGTAAAKSFKIASEGQITAVAPASKSLAKVPVTVTTIAGTGTSPSTFAYKGCKVPNLKGKKLKAAKKALKKAGCKLGKAKTTGGATTKTGKVKKQNPKAGKLLAPGTKINVKLG
jgi:hypothetical protein